MAMNICYFIAILLSSQFSLFLHNQYDPDFSFASFELPEKFSKLKRCPFFVVAKHPLTCNMSELNGFRGLIFGAETLIRLSFGEEDILWKGLETFFLT